MASTRTVFEKYREIQKLYRKFQSILKESEGTDDAVMKRIEKTARDKMHKLAGELKEGIAKLENAADLPKEVKEPLTAHLTKMKEEAKASFAFDHRMCYAVEDPNQGLILYYVAQGSYSSRAKDAKPIHLTLIAKENLANGFQGTVFGLHYQEQKADKEEVIRTYQKNRDEQQTGFYSANSGGLEKSLNQNVVIVLARNGFKAPESAGLTNKIKTLMDSLRFPRESMRDPQAELHGNQVTRSYRVHDYFEGRSGVEDDDHGNFTGHADALKVVERHFSEVKDKIEISLYPQEKDWFTVDISPKRPPKEAPKK